MENLNQTEATPTSARIAWKVPFNLQLFPPGLEFKIAYHIQASWVDTTVFHVRISAHFFCVFRKFFFIIINFFVCWIMFGNYLDCSGNRIVRLDE